MVFDIDFTDKRVQMWTAVQVSVLVLLGLVLAWIFESMGGLTSLFNWHPLVMTIAFGSMVYGVSSFRMLDLARADRKRHHWVANGLALLMMLAGIVIVYIFHNQIKAPHFYSPHSWLASATFVLVALQFLVGFLAFLCPPNWILDHRVCIKKYHIFSGIIAIAMFIATCVTGVMEKSTFIGDKTAVLPNIIVLAFILVGVVLTYAMRYAPNPYQLIGGDRAPRNNVAHAHEYQYNAGAFQNNTPNM